MRGGGWRPRPDAVVDRGAADRSDGSDSACAAVPLAGQPRFSRRVGRPGVRLGGALGAGATGAGDCAWQRWPAAGLLIVSPARLRRAQPRGGRSPASTGNPASNDCAQDTTSVARDGLRARSVRCFGVAGLRLAAGTSARLRTRHDVCRAPGLAAP